MAVTTETRAPGEISARPAQVHGEVDARALSRELIGAIGGEVRFSPGSRALYANDASVYRQVPIGVVIPRNAADVIAAVDVCRRHGAPICPRGCGTALAGQTVNEAVIFDFSKYMNEIVELDADGRRAVVQPGVVLDWLRDAAEEHDLTFGPDPATHTRCTLGGMIGNNSCGTHSILAGVTADNVLALEVLLYDGTRLTLPCQVPEEEIQRVIERGGREGEIYARLRDLRDRYAELIRERFPDIPRRISGYNLDDLLPERGFNVARALVGTEGTCVTVLEATLQLIPDPPAKCGVVIGYDDIATAGDHVLEALAHRPLAVEGFDDLLVEFEREASLNVEALDALPAGDGWMYVELGGETQEEAGERARSLLAELRPAAVDGKLVEDDGARRQLAQLREMG